MGGISDKMRSGVRISTVPSTHINIHPPQLDSLIMVMLPILLCSVLALSMALPTTDKDSAEVAYEWVTVTPSQEPDLSMVRQKRHLEDMKKPPSNVYFDKIDAGGESSSRVETFSVREKNGDTLLREPLRGETFQGPFVGINPGGPITSAPIGKAPPKGSPPPVPCWLPASGEFYSYGCPGWNNYYLGNGPYCPQPNSICNSVIVQQDTGYGGNSKDGKSSVLH